MEGTTAGCPVPLRLYYKIREVDWFNSHSSIHHAHAALLVSQEQSKWFRICSCFHSFAALITFVSA